MEMIFDNLDAIFQERFTVISQEAVLLSLKCDIGGIIYEYLMLAMWYI